MNKCKGCEYYGKPYWSIINPCDNCPRENTNVEIITRWQDPTIEELKTELQQKENIIKKVREKLIKSKEYQAVKSLGLNSKMSILIELEEMLEDKEV